MYHHNVFINSDLTGRVLGRGKGGWLALICFLYSCPTERLILTQKYAYGSHIVILIFEVFVELNWTICLTSFRRPKYAPTTPVSSRLKSCFKHLNMLNKRNSLAFPVFMRVARNCDTTCYCAYMCWLSVATDNRALVQNEADFVCQRSVCTTSLETASNRYWCRSICQKWTLAARPRHYTHSPHHDICDEKCDEAYLTMRKSTEWEIF